MAVLVMGGEKGGTGKTTLAVNLAVWRARRGRRVWLVDADPQQSASKWATVRAGWLETPAHFRPDVHVNYIDGSELAKRVKAQAANYDDVLIDTGGSDSGELRQAMLLADRLITPIRPSQFDIFTLGDMVKTVELATSLNERMDAVLLLNQVTTNSRSTDTVDVRDHLSAIKRYRLLSSNVANRKAWMRCGAEGRAVSELQPADPKAIAELDAIAAECWA